MLHKNGLGGTKFASKFNALTQQIKSYAKSHWN
jgi:hypothetical protein